MENRSFFRIAEQTFAVGIPSSEGNLKSLLPSFAPFQAQGDKGKLLFRIQVVPELQPRGKEDLERIETCDTGNGDIAIDRIHDGGYQFLVKDLQGQDCALLQTNCDFKEGICTLNGTEEMRRYGLNNALMLSYAFAGSLTKTLLIHASVVRHQDRGYAFTAKSGTGKSTHVGLWLTCIKDCDLMNDDNPVIRIVEGKAYIYGSPWSGKTPCYRNTKALLGAVTHIERATENHIERLSPTRAFATFLPSCSSMKWDHPIFNAICDTVTEVIGQTGIYNLQCLPNPAAARLSCQALTASQPRRE